MEVTYKEKSREGQAKVRKRPSRGELCGFALTGIELACAVHLPWYVCDTFGGHSWQPVPMCGYGVS